VSRRALQRELAILECDRAISGLTPEESDRTRELRAILAVADPGSLLCAAAIDLALVPPAECMPRNVETACIERVLAAVRASQCAIEARREDRCGPFG